MAHPTRSASKPRRFWQKHFVDWQSSGLSKAAYCRRHRLATGNFYNWCHILAKAGDAAPNIDRQPHELIAVSVVDSPSPFIAGGVTVSRLGTTIELPLQINADQLRVWLTAIHALHV